MGERVMLSDVADDHTAMWLMSHMTLDWLRPVRTFVAYLEHLPMHQSQSKAAAKLHHSSPTSANNGLYWLVAFLEMTW